MSSLLLADTARNFSTKVEMSVKFATSHFIRNRDTPPHLLMPSPSSIPPMMHPSRDFYGNIDHRAGQGKNQDLNYPLNGLNFKGKEYYEDSDHHYKYLPPSEESYTSLWLSRHGNIEKLNRMRERDTAERGERNCLKTEAWLSQDDKRNLVSNMDTIRSTYSHEINSPEMKLESESFHKFRVVNITSILGTISQLILQ